MTRNANLRRATLALVCGTLLGAVAPAATAQADNYPTKPVRIIVPFGPGGASDFVARILQPKLAPVLGQEIIVENKGGAAGNIGMELAARAAPDGYTVFLGNVGTVSINPSVFAKTLKLDPQKAFAPVTLVADTPGILIASASFPPNNVKDLVSYVRARQGQISFASPGSGSLNRLEMERFRAINKLDMIHVPYKAGAGQAVADVIGGQVPLMFTTISSAASHVKGGKLKGLAVTTTERLPVLPDVPTMIEAGFPDLISSSWQGVLVPAGTPPAVVRKLHAALLQVLKDADLVKRFGDAGVKVVWSDTPESFASYIAAETKRWSEVVQSAGATAD
jgi:tripartite-type tricarboxylate transporter receptor subunit TctC